MVQFQDVFLKMADFAKKEFPKEFEKAQKEYEEETSGAKAVSSGAFDIGFLSWFVLEREISGSELTPAEAYYYKFFESIPEDEFETMERLKDARQGIYEVAERRGKKYTIRDIFSEESFSVKTKDLDLKLDVDDLITATLVKISNRNYIFHGCIGVYPNDSKEKILADLKKSMEFTNLQMKKFIEYFHCCDPEFESMKEAFEANTKFIEWFNQQRAKELGTEPPKTIFQMPCIEEEFKRVGLVCTEAGICTVPNYGYIKDIISRHYEKVPEWEDLLYTIIEDEEFVPSSVLKKLMLDNKDSCVKVFSKAYDKIHSFDDVLELTRDYREDFDRKELPRVVSAEDAEKPSEESSKEKFSLKVKCRKCGKEFECDEENLVEGIHLCESCVKENESQLREFEKLAKSIPKNVKDMPEEERMSMLIGIMNTAFFRGNWDEFIKSAKEMGESLDGIKGFEGGSLVKMVEEAKERSRKETEELK